MNIGVIILNYVAYNVTIKCVKSFFKQSIDLKKDNVDFVIVDNFSENESYQVLKDYFNKQKNVAVVKTNKNLGFANGNNFGYNFLTTHFEKKYDFVICSNSDVILNEDGLYDWIKNCMNKYNFAVLGPSVYSVYGKFHQNPVSNMSLNIHELNKQLCKMQITKIKILIKKLTDIPAKASEVQTWKSEYKDASDCFTLHGSFQIFSYLYFEKYNEPYDSSTFLYMEENILKVRCLKEKLSMWYDPDYEIQHLQSYSTSKLSKDINTKNYFRMKNMCKSMKEYIRNVRNYEESKTIE